MKKLIFFILFLLFAITAYFVFFHQDKSLKFIPKEADAIVLIDVKKLKRESVFSLLTHPSEWFKDSEIKSMVSSLNNSGIKTPDFLQICHFKNQKFTDWSTVLEISNLEKFTDFLEAKNFANHGNQFYVKDDFFVKIVGNYCFAATSINSLGNHLDSFRKDDQKKTSDADSFIKGTSASITFLGKKNYSYAIELLEDEIEISNAKNTKNFKPLIAQLRKKNLLFNANLDEKNTKTISEFWLNKKFDSLQLSDIKMIANLESVNDTIVTYEYDDNFNEVEKKSFQKITKPNYIISAKSLNPTKTLEFLKKEKWINAENQIITVPYQPNLVIENKDIFTVKSPENSLTIDKNQKGNFIFFKNDPLLINLIPNFSPSQKNLLSKIDHIFYGNEEADYLVKIKFKKGKMPLILK